MSVRAVASWAGLLTGVALSATCEDSTAPVTAVRIDVLPSIVRLRVGQSVQLAATARDDAGSAVSGVVLRFESDSLTIATVSPAGVVTGTGAGATTVLVSGAGASARVPVRVGGVPAMIEVTPGAPEIIVGGSVGLIVVVRDSDGVVVPDAAVSYFTSDPAVATVTPTAVVAGVAAGPATITVSAVPAIRSVNVAVLGRPTGTDVTRTPLDNRPYGIAVSAGGAVYATRPDAGAVARATLPGTTFTAAIPVGQNPTDVAFDPIGIRAYVTNQLSGSVSVIDVAANTTVDEITVPGPPLRVLVAPNGGRLYVTTGSGSLFVFDLPSKALYAEYVLGAASNGLAFHPTGFLLYGTTYAGLVFEINTVTDSARALLTSGTLQDIAVSRDGAFLYIAKQDGELEIRSAPTGALATTLPAASNVFGLKLTPDGTQLYTTTIGASRVRVIDRLTRTIVRDIAGPTDPRRIAFDRYGRTAIVTDQNGDVFFIR